MNKNFTILVSIILAIGILYRLALTANGNFFFNMDNARDMVDVREMIVLGKLRLTGPTSAIEGLFNGPFWYYLLAIPFVLSGGDPYGSIITEIILWAIGGFFLLKLVKDYGSLVVIALGAVWIASNYIVLTNLYAFNPNPVTLLTPLFIYLLVNYLEKKKAFSIITAWFLAGLFFNFEMNFGVFTPLIILSSILLTNNAKLFRDKFFWIGGLVFILTLAPQIIFDIRHQFLMSKAIISFLTQNSHGNYNFFQRLAVISESFLGVFSATLMNHKNLSLGILILFLPLFGRYIKKKADPLVLVSTLFISIPFLGYLIIPVTVNAWHLGGSMSASLILVGFLIYQLWRRNFFGKMLSVTLAILLIFYSLSNIANFFIYERGEPSMDPSSLRNEIRAIDYVYQKAGGKNFKVYSYLPSVYDYPYQYLFWWYGQKRYGYIPADYAYSANKPPYIPSQDKFQGRKDNFSGLIFLIKEPDRNYTRFGWEGDFIKFNWKTIGKQMVGPLEIEIRREL